MKNAEFGVSSALLGFLLTSLLVAPNVRAEGQRGGSSSVDAKVILPGPNFGKTAHIMTYSVAEPSASGDAAQSISRVMSNREEQRSASEQSKAAAEKSEGFYSRDAQRVSEATAARNQEKQENYLANVANIAQTAKSLPNGFVSSSAANEKLAKQIMSDPLAFRKYNYDLAQRKTDVDEAERSLTAGTYLRATRLLEPLAATGELTGRAKEVVNKDGIYEFERIDKKVPLSPLSVRMFSTGRATEPGQIVRRVANKYQAVWANSRGLQEMEDYKRLLFVGGLAALASSDEALANPMQREKGSGLLKVASDIVESFISKAHFEADQMIRAPAELFKNLPALSMAIGEGTGSLGYALVHYGANPDQAIQKIVEFIGAIPGMRDQMWALTAKQLELMSDATPREIGEVLGSIVVQSTAMLVTAGSSPFLEGKAIQSLETAVDVSRSVNIGRSAALPALMQVEIKQWMPIVAKYETALGREVAQSFVATAAYIKTPAGQVTKLGKSGWTLTEGKLDKIVARAEEVAARMPAKGKPERVLGFRGLRKEFVEANMRAGMTEIEAVHAWHELQNLTPHRFSGTYVSGLYVSNSKVTNIAELGSESGYVFAAKEYRLKNVLDLTDPKVRRLLGIRESEIRGAVEDFLYAYELPQVIGFLAERNGYDAVKFYSAQVPESETAINWLIFAGNVK